jgi:uncharacterized lipoprotein YajG
MNFRTLSTALLLAGVALLGGCATSRSELKVASPSAAALPAVSASARTFVIRSIKDERVFEQAPKQASTPSLGFESAASATQDIKARAIGRKRGGFGLALGDVLLENGQTVTGLVRENLTAAFQQAGFRVVAEANAGPAPLLVDVRIKQFWAWFQPGFWALTLNTNIETDLELTGAVAPIKLSVHVEDSRQVATDSAWLEVVDKALAAYRAQASSRAASPPF